MVEGAMVVVFSVVVVVTGFWEVMVVVFWVVVTGFWVVVVGKTVVVKLRWPERIKDMKHCRPEMWMQKCH